MRETASSPAIHGLVATFHPCQQGSFHIAGLDRPDSSLVGHLRDGRLQSTVGSSPPPCSTSTGVCSLFTGPPDHQAAS
jgi:hypothetical protein